MMGWLFGTYSRNGNKMMTYEEFLDEPIPVNMSNPMRREDYYKNYMKGIDPKGFYNQLVKIWQEKK